jgi:hypothetical protein
MGRPKRPIEVERAPEPDPPFIDEEEREIIESYEAALERGEVHGNSAEELAKINAEWKAIVEESRANKPNSCDC